MPLQFPSTSPASTSQPETAAFSQSCRDGHAQDVEAALVGQTLSREVLAHGLRTATAGDHPAIMKTLLENGAEITEWTVYEVKSRADVEVLMAHGLEVNNPMPYALVPVIAVAVRNDPGLLEWFLSLGADPNLGPPDTSEKGYISPHDPVISTSGSALEQSARFCSTTIIDILVRHGAKLENSLALHHALFRKQPSERIPMMDHLLNLGMPVNSFGCLPTIPHGGTPLHQAADSGLADEARWLMEHGADPYIQGRSNTTAQGLASLRGHHELSASLIKWAGEFVKEDRSDV